MAEGEKVGKSAGHMVDLLDHPLIFAISLVFVIVPIMALMNWGFTAAGLPGPAGLFKHP